CCTIRPRSRCTSRRQRRGDPEIWRTAMLAGVLYGLGDLRVEDRPEPRCGPGEVVIEVAYNGLCGTDATEYAKGSILVPLDERHPGSGHVGATILGHEFVGTVVAAGGGT